jgi:hypothetical protein
LDEVDTAELGDAIDMIKDLEEAIYYSTVTEAMNKQGKEMHMNMKNSDHHQKPEDDRMYYDGYPMYYADGGHVNSGNGTSNTNSSNGRNYYDEPMWRDEREMRNPMGRDEREGRSPMSRRMYMEAKHMNKDKATQLRELEKYMQELSQDITDMIADASPEEKQYLEKKITALASKIGSMK